MEIRNIKEAEEFIVKCYENEDLKNEDWDNLPEKYNKIKARLKTSFEIIKNNNKSYNTKTQAMNK